MLNAEPSYGKLIIYTNFQMAKEDDVPYFKDYERYTADLAASYLSGTI